MRPCAHVLAGVDADGTRAWNKDRALCACGPCRELDDQGATERDPPAAPAQKKINERVSRFGVGWDIPSMPTSTVTPGTIARSFAEDLADDRAERCSPSHLLGADLGCAACRSVHETRRAAHPPTAERVRAALLEQRDLPTVRSLASDLMGPLASALTRLDLTTADCWEQLAHRINLAAEDIGPQRVSLPDVELRGLLELCEALALDARRPADVAAEALWGARTSL